MEKKNTLGGLRATNEEITFEQKVKNYIATRNPKLVILTPCYGSMCFVNYVTCLIHTLQLFKEIGFPVKVEFCRNDSLVSRARNNLIAKAMNDPATTHFMFIDSDIAWNPVDILRLAIADKPLVGGVYPIKHYNWDRLINQQNSLSKWFEDKKSSQVNQICSDEQFLQSKLLRFNINHVSSVLEVENNLTKVRHLATGFMLIQRNVIEKMSQAFPSTKYTDDVGFLHGEENKHAYALFECGVEDGHYFSEDWLFCSRWNKMGGETWVDVTINLNHTGVEDYNGSFIASLV